MRSGGGRRGGRLLADGAGDVYRAGAAMTPVAPHHPAGQVSGGHRPFVPGWGAGGEGGRVGGLGGAGLGPRPPRPLAHSAKATWGWWAGRATS